MKEGAQEIFYLPEILREIEARLVKGEKETSFTGISTDSRTIRPGELFIALKGENYDGHHFIIEAEKKGARGVVAERGNLNRKGEGNFPASLLEVEDTVKFLGDLAGFWRSKKAISVVTITGSNGKTTSKEMTASILSLKTSTLKGEGNFNNLIGLPLSLLKLRDHHRFGVVELGMNRSGEIRRLTEIAQPDVGLITNLNPSHLENFPNFKGMMREKKELLDFLAGKGVAIINADDKNLLDMAYGHKGSKITYGIYKDSEIRGENIRILGKEGASFILKAGGKTIPIHLKLLGIQNVSNALAASAVALSLGIDMDTIKKGIESCVPLAHRLELLELKRSGITLLDDSYNSNPASVKAAIDGFTRIRGSKEGLIILGDMLELGKGSPLFHYQVGRMVGKAKPDKAIFVGNFAPILAKGSLKEGLERVNVLLAKDTEEAFQKLKSFLKGRDYLILVKGSRRLRMERIANWLKEIEEMGRN